MSRPKIRVIGDLRSAEDGGLFFHISLDGFGDPLRQPLQNYHDGAAPLNVFWLEALPEAYGWGGKFPSKRKWEGKARTTDEPLEPWLAARDAEVAKIEAEYVDTLAAYNEHLHSDERYQKAATELRLKQHTEPVDLPRFDGHSEKREGTRDRSGR